MAASFNRFPSFKVGWFGVIFFVPTHLRFLGYAVDSYLFGDRIFCQTFRGKRDDPGVSVNIGIDFIAVLGLFKICFRYASPGDW